MASRKLFGKNFDDHRMEEIMGHLLRFGVIFASTVVLAGGFFYLNDHAGERPDYRHFAAYPLRLRHPAELLSGLAHGRANAIVQLGILLLIATPIARVAFAAIAFTIERDKLYVAISLTVLAVLLYGMLRAG